MPESAAGLFASNTPQSFWRLQLEPQASAADWANAISAAAGELPPAARVDGDQIEALLNNTLGEGQFGPGHFRLSASRRTYYFFKPFLPRAVTTALRRVHRGVAEKRFHLAWPAETRFVRFLCAAAGRLARERSLEELAYVCFWPEGRRFALVLTHDVESAAGQAFVSRVADLEERLGFRSSFNFVAEGYPLDRGLIGELRSRGFEVGVHGRHHDGKLFASRRRFMIEAARVNHHLRELDACGFRSPLTHRHPVWMQALDVEYDLSYFDTDPYEPMPGGVMTLWPFRLGRFIELPYTLVQDHTLYSVLHETTPRLWFEKLELIRSAGGMALLNSHPDYLRWTGLWKLYEELLERLLELRDECWHALPRDTARWWKERAHSADPLGLPGARIGMLEVDEQGSVRLGRGALPLAS